MRFFQVLSRRVAMKITSVATLELAMRQLKQSQKKKSREIQLIQFPAALALAAVSSWYAF